MAKGNGMVSLHHLGIAVKDLDEATWRFEALGFTYAHTEKIEEHGVEAMILQAGKVRIELLVPTQKDSPIQKFLDKHGPGFHHMALQVENLTKTMLSLQKQGIPCLYAKPKRGIEGKGINFIHPKEMAGVLVELLGDVQGK